jgi:hypothetical protein
MKMSEQLLPSKADSAPRLNTRDRRASSKELAETNIPASKSCPSQIYVFQVMHPSEDIEGEFSSLEDGNNRALNYPQGKHSIKCNELWGERVWSGHLGR